MTEALTIQPPSPSMSPPLPRDRASSSPDATLASLLASPSSLPLTSPSSPSPLNPPLSPTSARLHKRTKLIAEIHDTERHYSTSLTATLTHYLTPLRANPSDLSLKPDTLTTIFSNLEQLASFHAVFSAELAKATTPRDVCLTFNRFVDFLRIYIPYVNGYSEAMQALQTLQDNKRWLKFAAEKKQAMGLDLMSYLIMPVQRIPRYELLLKELKRNLDPPPPTHSPSSSSPSPLLHLLRRRHSARRDAGQDRGRGPEGERGQARGRARLLPPLHPAAHHPPRLRLPRAHRWRRLRPPPRGQGGHPVQAQHVRQEGARARPVQRRAAVDEWGEVQGTCGSGGPQGGGRGRGGGGGRRGGGP